MKKRYKILSILLALVIAIGSVVTISIVSSSAESFTDENGIEWTVTENYPGWAISNVNKSQMVGNIVFPEHYEDKLIIAINGTSGIFKNCTELTSITLPNSIEYIHTGAFEGCTGLTSINLGNGVKNIGSSAFKGCTGLTSVTIPDGVKTIGNNAFWGCTGLTSITIPDSVITIGTNTFNGCTDLTSINLGNGVKNIGSSAFKGCTGLTSVIVPDSVIDLSGFNNCTGLTSVNIPDGVTTISSSAFSGCTGLTSVNIPESVTAIGSGVFSGCTGLTSVTIPDGVKTIGNNAFSGCTGLTSITIPDSVTYIDYNAFYGCSNLTKVNINQASIKYIHSDAFPINLGISGTPTATPINYVDDNNISWNLIENTTGYTIKPTDKTALSGDITIPDSCNNKPITEIASSAFSGCTGLTSVNIPDSVTTISSSAFSGCTGLTSVNIPDSVNDIGASAFYQCRNLTGELVISDTVTTIGDYAFYNCHKLTTLHIGKGIKTISISTFEGCSGLTSITIPESTTKIEDRAFAYCRNAFKNGLTIGKNVEYVGHNAFAYCGNIDTLTIETPNTSNIHITAFYADTFNNLIVGDTVTEIDSVILSGNKNFASVGLGSSLTISSPYAFYGNSNMTIETTSDATNVITYATTNNIPYTIVNNVDVARNVSFEVTCDKTVYEFTVYKVADLESTTHPYEVRYDSLIDSVDDEIFNGDSEGLLAGLDEVSSSELTEIVGTYSTDVDGTSKLFENLEPGIYYVRATNFPANVYGVQNSVFALPYYDATEGWIYEIDPIPLATKVDESNPEIEKTITNSTQENVNFTDVSLGDTVNFEIEASRVGSANVVDSKDFKLNSYVVSDIMESGLTLNQDSFVVTLEDIDGNTLATLEDTTDYIVNIVASEGVDTTFTVSLTPEYLQEDEFYSSANVVIAYSAVLNEYSTREFDGNYNTATNLTYTNKTNVSATVDGNTIYAYTFGIEVNKYDDAGTPLAGSQFALYLTEDDAKAMKNEIATGTSTDTGKVEFFTTDNDVIKLQSGTYYIVETKATENYNRYTDVIPVTITVEYGETEVNGTYIESAPENGIQLVEVKNSKVVIPNTGGDGAMYRYIIALAFAMLAVTLVVLKKRSSKKATATK